MPRNYHCEASPIARVEDMPDFYNYDETTGILRYRDHGALLPEPVAIDCTHLPGLREVIVEYRSELTNYCAMIKVKDGVKVRSFSPERIRVRTHVFTDTGHQHKAMNHIYWAYRKPDCKSLFANSTIRFKKVGLAIQYVSIQSRIYSDVWNPDIFRGHRIFCRHLVAHAYRLRQRAKETHQSWAQVLADEMTVEKIPQMYGGHFIAAEHDYSSLVFLNDEYKCSVPNFGKLLVKLTNQKLEMMDLQEGQTVETCYSVGLIRRTPENGHAALLVLKVKKDQAGEIKYKIQFYDPNATNSQFGFITDSLEELKEIDVPLLLGLTDPDHPFPYVTAQLSEIDESKTFDDLPWAPRRVLNYVSETDEIVLQRTETLDETMGKAFLTRDYLAEGLNLVLNPILGHNEIS
jgi:hypothetical protein